MESTLTMTPDEYITQIRDMVSAGKHAEVLAFADEHRESVEPPLTPYQKLLVADTLHVSAMTMDMEEYAARKDSEQAEVA